MSYANLVTKKKQYKYSANICFDMKDEEKLAGFIPNITTTEIHREYLLGIINQNADVHSRILYGSYGTGKSHAALTVKSLLDEGEYDYRIADGQGLVYEINKDQLSDANILINSNNILTETFKLTDVVSGSLTTTEADKEKLYTAYLQGELTSMLEDVEFVQEDEQ